MKYIIGIDPGLKGGVGILKDGELYNYFAMPTDGNRIDTHELFISLNPYTYSVLPTAYIEKQQTRGNQGGNLTIGENSGRIKAVLEMLGIDYVEVDPKTWQRRMMAEELYQRGDDTKQAALLYCQNRAWQVPARSNRADSPFNDGISDALVIAAYGAELARVEDMRT